MRNVTPASPTPPLIVLYDGVCGMCNWWVQFLLKRDTYDRFQFAAIQSPVATEMLRRHHIDAAALNTIYVVQHANSAHECIVSRSTAVLVSFRRLGSAWTILGLIGTLIPAPLRNWLYDRVAKYRYKLFGYADHCAIPTPRDRAKFLDGDSFDRDI